MNRRNIDPHIYRYLSICRSVSTCSWARESTCKSEVKLLLVRGIIPCSNFYSTVPRAERNIYPPNVRVFQNEMFDILLSIMGRITPEFIFAEKHTQVFGKSEASKWILQWSHSNRISTIPFPFWLIKKSESRVFVTKKFANPKHSNALKVRQAKVRHSAASEHHMVHVLIPWDIFTYTIPLLLTPDV